MRGNRNRGFKPRRWIAGLLLCLFTLQSVTAFATSCGALSPDTGPAPTHEMVEHAHQGMASAAGDKPAGCCCADGGYCSASDCLVPVAFIAPVSAHLVTVPAVPQACHHASAPFNLPPELFRPPIAA